MDRGPSALAVLVALATILVQPSLQASPHLQLYQLQSAHSPNAFGTSTIFRTPPTQSLSVPVQQFVTQTSVPVPLISPPAPCNCGPPAPCNCASPPCKPSKKCKCQECRCDPCHCTAEDERIHALEHFLDRASDYYFTPILDDPCEKPKSCFDCRKPCKPKSRCCNEEDDYDYFWGDEEDDHGFDRSRRPSSGRDRGSPPSRDVPQPPPPPPPSPTSPGRPGGRGGGAVRGGGGFDDDMPREGSRRRKGNCRQKSKKKGNCCGKPVCCCKSEPEYELYDYFY